MMYGFDPEFEHAYRCWENKPECREYAMDWQYPEDVDGFMVAQFADGSLAPIYALTLGEWMAKTKSAGGKKALWEGKTPAGARLTIGRRKDRRPLVCLYEDGGQVLQIAIKDIKGEDTEDKKAEKAVAIMKVIAEEYAAGKIKHDQLFQKRCELVGLGAVTSRRVSMKRPAASDATSQRASQPASSSQAQSIAVAQAAPASAPPPKKAKSACPQVNMFYGRPYRVNSASYKVEHPNLQDTI